MEVQKDIQEREMEALFNEAKELMLQHCFDESIVKLDALIGIANPIDNHKLLGLTYGSKGMIAYRRGDINHAFEFFKNALNYFLNGTTSCFEEIKQIKNSLGAIYRMFGEPMLALQTYFESISISEKYNFHNSVAYNNIGVLYLGLTKYEEALRYFQVALHKEELLENPNRIQILTVLENIATAYFQLGRIDEAFVMRSKNIKKYEENKNYDLLIQSLNGIVLIYLKKYEYEKARELLLKAVDLSVKYDYNVYLVDLKLKLAEIFKVSSEECKQFKTLQEALNIAENSCLPKVIPVLEKMRDYYLDTYDYREASVVIRRILALKEAAFEKEKKEKLLELQNTFESKQKDKLIAQECDFQQKLKTKQQKLKAALVEQKAMDLHLKSLQLQLSPHFIFNTLQSIQSYIFEKDPFLASDYLATFASLMRTILSASRQGSLSLFEEKLLLEQYLDLEQKRFNHSFDYCFKIQEGLNSKEQYIPSLLVQPFVENAILHGVSGVKKGRIRIVFRSQNRRTYIHVIDNGKGRWANKKRTISNKKETSTALKIMKEREEMSQNSPKQIFNFRIIDLKKDRKALGTHVVIRLEQLA